MKKMIKSFLLVFFFTALMSFTCFTGCKKDINDPTVLTCDEEYSFLLANPVSSLPESLDEASWICFVSKNRNKAETIESNLDYFFFAYVNTDMTFQYYAYLNSTEAGKNEQTSSITELKSEIDYWCIITSDFYEEHKSKLPECIKQSPFQSCDEEYSFLLANPVSSLPESLDEASWICLVFKDRNKAETIESNLDYFFFAYVNTDMTFQYYAYLDSTEAGKNEQTSSITEAKSELDYWCIITSDFYEEHKSKLPECIKQSPFQSCDEEYSFLLANPVSSLPESLDEASWICLVFKDRNKAETIESNLDYFFFAYVNTDMTFQYYAYLDSTEAGKNEQTSSITEAKSELDYWCIITSDFYEEHKSKLPECIKQSPQE